MPTVDARDLNGEWLPLAVSVLRRGRLVAFPTETVYGLGARALDPDALRRVFEAKGRPATHPLIAHVLDVAQAMTLTTEWPTAAGRLASAFWPGPLTLVVPRAGHVPRELAGGGESIAVRAPSHLVARALLAALGEPIAAPSANRYQSVSPTTAAHVERSLGDHVDIVLDGGPCSAGIESTVVDVTGDIPRVLRLGAIDLPTLQTIEPRSAATSVDVSEHAVRPSPGMDSRHYSPRAPLIVASSREYAVSEALVRAHRGEKVALLLVSRTDAPLVAGGLLAAVLGPSPTDYARELYAALHRCNDEPALSVILVEPVPDAPAWSAIADRLARAAVR